MTRPVRPEYHHSCSAAIIGATVFFVHPWPSSSFAPSSTHQKVWPDADPPTASCCTRTTRKRARTRQLSATPTSDASITPIDISIIDGPFSKDTFASTGCWGRRPVLIRRAFDAETLLSQNAEDEEPDDGEEEQEDGESAVSMWPSWNDVALLSCDEEGESRLITHRPGDPYSWDLQLGPFEDEDVANILDDKNTDQIIVGEEEDKWTLVVNDVDRFFPSLADWVDEEYAFIPRWRRDDAQISLSDAGGGIGPHVDNYDVFLIQMSGRRTWEVGKRFISEQEEYETLVGGIDVRILSTWEEDRQRGYVERFELDPGDVLYLPPRIPHCGVALTDGCMTLSVGLRSPSANDMVSRLAEIMTTSVAGKAVQRITDEDLLESNDAGNSATANANNSGEISPVAKEKARKLVKAALEEYMDNDEEWDKIFGQLATECKRPRINYPAPLIDGDEEELGIWGNPKLAVAAVVEGRGALYQAEGITFGYSILGEASSARLFVNGEAWDLVRSEEGGEVDIKLLLQAITSNRRLNRQTFDSVTKVGGIHPEDDDDDTDDEGGSPPRTNFNLPEARIVALLEDLVQGGYLYGADE